MFWNRKAISVCMWGGGKRGQCAVNMNKIDYLHCSSFLSIAVINTMTQSKLGRRGFILLCIVHHEGESGQEPRGKSCCRGYEGELLTDLLLMVFSVCFM